MVRAALAVLAIGCAPIRQIPAPEPVKSLRPPTNARAHYLRGQVLLASGRLEEAASALERARVFDPDAPQIVQALSDVSLNLGDTAAARQFLATGTQIAPDDATIWAQYGRLELAFGDRTVGRAALERALALGADWPVRAALIGDDLRQGQPSTMLVDWTVSGPEEQRRRGDLRLASGDAAGAIEDFLAVLPHSGRDLSLVTPILHSASMTHRIPDTLLVLDALCVEQASASAAWLTSGLLSSLIGDSAGTVTALEVAQDLGVTLGERPQAALEQARLSEGAPTKPKASPLLDDPVSRAMRLIEDEAWPEAKESLTRSLVDHPEDVRLHDMLADLHARRGQPAEALARLEKIFALQPSFPPALNLWAWIHAEEGSDLAEAEQRALAALRAQPRVGSYWDTFGWIAHLQGDRVRARFALKRALRLAPQDDTIREHLAACDGEGGT